MRTDGDSASCISWRELKKKKITQALKTSFCLQSAGCFVHWCMLKILLLQSSGPSGAMRVRCSCQGSLCLSDSPAQQSWGFTFITSLSQPQQMEGGVQRAALKCSARRAEASPICLHRRRCQDWRKLISFCFFFFPDFSALFIRPAF